jgi:peptide/nickel transport system ATP-binding protein
MHNGQRQMKVNELLDMVGLPTGFYSRLPHQLSGGERQRVCIARALACEPELLICDEPVSALDVSVQAQLLNLINSLKREKKFSCIFISHDLSVLRFMCDRIVVMNGGKIEESGFADQIFSSPQSEYTKKLISSVPYLA